jgi:2-dehydro-3-deoxyphosphogluconate aldolase/(4S)-4-hydroxy-2-oxoglutarate aldolase
MRVLNTMLEVGMIPVFYNPDLEVSKKVVQACAAGGAWKNCSK